MPPTKQDAQLQRTHVIFDRCNTRIKDVVGTKKDDCSLDKNYGPVTGTCQVAKAIEKLVSHHSREEWSIVR